MSDSLATTSDNLGKSPAADLTGKIMVVIIIVLFMVVVSSVVFYLYAKLFWWRRDSQSRSRSFVASGQNGALGSGLDPSVLKSLPISAFQSQDLKDGLECSVCLSEVVEGEKVRLLPKCNHGFHVDCIDMWFQSHATCPLCRSPVASSDDSDEPNVASLAPDNLESLSFPTNVLIWGNLTQISSTAASLELEESTTSHPPSSPSSSGGSCSNSNNTTNNRHHGMLVIDIPSGREVEDTSSSSARRFAEDELKSPVIRRLRSLRRLLSNNRLNPWSPTSTDVEQAKGGGGQS